MLLSIYNQAIAFVKAWSSLNAQLIFKLIILTFEQIVKCRVDHQVVSKIQCPDTD